MFIDTDYIIQVKDYMLNHPKKKIDWMKSEELHELDIITVTCNGYY